MAISTKPPAASRSRVKETPNPEPFKPSIVQDAQSRSERARAYEDKVAGILNLAMRMCAGNEGTVSDAAAFIEHGPGFASKLGDLAAHDARIRKGIDFITTGTDNPYAAVVLAALPLISQIIRNHETETAKPLEVRIPFTKRTFRPKIKIRLNIAFLRGMTTTPAQLVRNVFGRPDVKAALITSGIDVALPEYRNLSNGANGHTA